MARLIPHRSVAAAIVADASVAVAAALIPAGEAASPKASCIGIEASEISPPGSSEEFPGGVPELGRVVRDIAGALGVPPGAIVSSVAKVHAGSHEACDEATG
jgi:hypothetical protein